MPISAACIAALDAYVANPWQWLRESDLVAHLVSYLQEHLEQRTTQITEFFADENPPRPILGAPLIDVPRLRTEVKLGGKRIDICLLKRDPCCLFIGGFGIRDVVLRIRPQDVEVLLEVKFDPYLNLEMRNGHRTSSWINDLIKLHQLKAADGLGLASTPMHLLAVDTALPIATVGGFPIGPQIGAGIAQNGGALAACWPLTIGTQYHIPGYRYPRANPATWNVTLNSVARDAQTGNGIYLWAIGVINDVANPTLQCPTNPEIPGNACQASCWEVDVARA